MSKTASRWIAFAFCAALCAGEARPAAAQVLEQTFSDSLAQFKVSTPNHHWKLEPRGIDPGDSKLTVRFEAPLHQFVPNVTVRVVEKVDPEKKLGDWVEEEIKGLPQGWEVMEKKDITHRGMKGVELVFKETSAGILFRQRFFLAKGNSYVLTCTAKEASVPRVEGDFIKILNSFEII